MARELSVFPRARRRNWNATAEKTNCLNALSRTSALLSIVVTQQRGMRGQQSFMIDFWICIMSIAALRTCGYSSLLNART